jgi:hypothetical protein
MDDSQVKTGGNMLKTLKACGLFCLVLPQIAFCNDPDTLWTRAYGWNNLDWGWEVQQTYDGGYIVAGQATPPGAFWTNAWLLKIDASGDTVWSKIYGDNDCVDGMYSTSDSGYIMVGSSLSTITDNESIWLIKTDANGDTAWTKRFRSDADDWGRSVRQTYDGGYIITGITECWGPTIGDLILLKTDSAGVEVWSRPYYGDYFEWGESVRQTSDSGYIVTGWTESYGAGASNVWLLKTDANGDTLWAKTYGGNEDDQGRCVEQTPDGGYIVAAITNSFGSGNSAVWLIKTDADGDTLWTRVYGEETGAAAYSVEALDNGYYIVAGEKTSPGTGSDVWVLKVRPDGDTSWTRTYGGNYSDWADHIQQTSDGGYIVTGATYSYGAGDMDMWLLKLTAVGVEEESNYQLSTGNGQLSIHPNPFTHNTVMEFIVHSSEFVDVETRHVMSLHIHDLSGRLVKSFPFNHLTIQPFNQITWDGTDNQGKSVPKGIYLCKIKAGSKTVAAHKLVRIR